MKKWKQPAVVENRPGNALFIISDRVVTNGTAIAYAVDGLLAAQAAWTAVQVGAGHRESLDASP